jgi:hypothetical protein
MMGISLPYVMNREMPFMQLNTSRNGTITRLKGKEAGALK